MPEKRAALAGQVGAQATAEVRFSRGFGAPSQELSQVLRTARETCVVRETEGS